MVAPLGGKTTRRGRKPSAFPKPAPGRHSSPVDVLCHLTFALDDVPDDRAAKAMRKLLFASCVVMRHLVGQRGADDAYRELDEARELVLAARRKDNER